MTTGGFDSNPKRVESHSLYPIFSLKKLHRVLFLIPHEDELRFFAKGYEGHIRALLVKKKVYLQKYHRISHVVEKTYEENGIKTKFEIFLRVFCGYTQMKTRIDAIFSLWERVRVQN